MELRFSTMQSSRPMGLAASSKDPLPILEQADRLQALLSPRAGVLRLCAAGAAALTHDVRRRAERVAKEAFDVLRPDFRRVAIFSLDDGWRHGATVALGNHLVAVQATLAYRGWHLDRIVEGGSVPTLSEEVPHRPKITEHWEGI